MADAYDLLGSPADDPYAALGVPVDAFGPTSGYPFVGASSPRGMLTPGNIDLSKRPKVKNADGSISTVRSISFDEDGKEVVIPTVVGDRVVSNQEAIQHYRKTGEHLGIFDNPDDATAYAQGLHEQQAAQYGSDPFAGLGDEMPAAPGPDLGYAARNRQAAINANSSAQPAAPTAPAVQADLQNMSLSAEQGAPMPYSFMTGQPTYQSPDIGVPGVRGQRPAAYQGRRLDDGSIEYFDPRSSQWTPATSADHAAFVDPSGSGQLIVFNRAGLKPGVINDTFARLALQGFQTNAPARAGQLAKIAETILPVEVPVARAAALEARTASAAPGMVRMYHGGEDVGQKGPMWFTSDQNYARDYAAKTGGNAKVYYVDIPESHPAIAPDYPEQSVKQGFHVNTELPADVAARRKLLVTSSPALEVPPARAEAAPLSPGLTEPRIAPTISKNVVNAAGDLLLAGKVQRNPNVLISDQISGLLSSGKLTAQTIDDVLAKHQVTAPMLADLFRSDIRQAARSMQNLSALQQRLNLAGMIETLPDGSVGKFLVDATKPTWRDRLGYLWINSLVSGLPTHAANVLSNALTALWSVPETAVAGAIGTVRRAAGGKGGVYIGEVAQRGAGLVGGFADGMVAAARAFKTGQPADMISKVDIGHAQPLGKIGAWTVGLPTRLLMAEDELFKAVAYRSEINAQALRMAKDEGLRGRAMVDRANGLRADPPPELQAAGERHATYQTFQSDLGKFGNALMALRTALPGSEIVLPFVRTPANILKWATERSPFGLLLKDVRGNLAGKNGPAARDTAIARMLLGTTGGVAVASLAAEGKITGSGPQDPQKRAAMLANGWQSYSVNIGGKWYGYNRLDPLGLMMGVTADMVEAKGQIDHADADKIGAMVATSISQNLLNRTYLSGLSNMVAALHDPGQFGESYIRNLAASVVPAGVAQYARTQDPVIRDARTMMDAIKARIPGLSQSLPAKLNVFGEPVTRPGSFGPDLVSPVKVSQPRNDASLNEMIRLDAEPAMPDRQIRGVDLTPEQYAEFVTLAGKPLKATLDKLVAGAGWQRLPDFARKEAIDSVVQKTRKAAAEAMLMRHPELAKASVDQKLQQRGLGAPQ